MPLAQNGGNTKLGQNWGTGIVRGVRPLVHMDVTGFRKVDSNTTFLPGQFVKLGSDSKVTAFTTGDAATAKPVGMSVLAKSAPFYLPYTEQLEWVAAGETINLKYPNVKQLILINAAGTTITLTTGYTANLTNGVITTVTVSGAGNTPAVGAFVTARYQFKDTSHAPFDETLASGQVALIESNGEVALEVYDTGVAYSVNGYVTTDDTGTVTSTGANSTNAVGWVTRTPSADDVTLGIKITCF